MHAKSFILLVCFALLTLSAQAQCKFKTNEANIPALAMMEKLSAEGWEFQDMELVDNGVRYIYIMKRIKK